MPFNSFDDYPMSWRPVLRRKPDRPLYKALAQQLEEDIAKGVLRPGTKLPPQRELADFLEVDRSGLSAEISKLRKEGVLESERSTFRLL